jgi:hypothetical protein
MAGCWPFDPATRVRFPQGALRFRRYRLAGQGRLILDQKTGVQIPVATQVLLGREQVWSLRWFEEPVNSVRSRVCPPESRGTVSHLLWEQAHGGSSPLSPTISQSRWILATVS